MATKIMIETSDNKLLLAIAQALAVSAGGTVELKTAGTPIPKSALSETSGDSATDTHTEEDAGATSQQVSNSNEKTVTLDEKGVAKNDKFCATAAEPFYTSGKREGQWKKRKGVSDDDYDEWYSGELLAHTVSEDDAEEERQEFDSGSVFGQKEDKPQPDAIADIGGLMGWVSEMQTAGHLKMEDMQEALNVLKLPMDAMINGDSAAANIGKVHNYLKMKAGV